MKILIASSEVIPFIKTGGLGDVTGTLVNEYKKAGVDAAVILPLYRKIKKTAGNWNITPLEGEITVPLGKNIEKGRLWNCKTSEGADAYFIENDKFYDRDEIYSIAAGDYTDNISRFIFFNRGVLEALKLSGFEADIIHCNDWQTGLIPVYLKTVYKDIFPGTATLMTVHNVGYQGIFEKSGIPLTGLGQETFNDHSLEHNGKINFLKAGLLFADVITTVSDNYAREILTVEYGFGLEDVLKQRRTDIYGIVNGIDYSEWDPEKDTYIPANYNVADLSGKAECKKSLQKICGLPVNNSMIIGMVTRLSSQKGLDLVAESMKKLTGSGMQVIILGKGDESLHTIFSKLQKKHSGKLSVTTGFDNVLAHRIYAGSDIFLMPSQYEPCGLGQLIALRYGTVPVARRTGGLSDTISEYDPSNDTGTGFLFDRYSSKDLFNAVKKARKFFNSGQSWEKIQKNAMSLNFSWERSAKAYLSLYQKTLTEKN